LSSEPIFRFAPSPNGHLHLGHAYSALFTWRAAEAMGGIALLRIEDIDTTRCKPEFAHDLMEDLRWLGLDWPEPVMVQSERIPVYSEAASRLRERGLIYPCFCSRSQMAASTGPDGGQFYGGACRHLSPDERRRRIAAGEPHAWRIAMDRALDETGPLGWRELDIETGALTETRARPERWGDTVIVRKDAPANYHLAVVIDDADQGITNVTRGRDMEASTDVHAVLQALLGLPQPIYTFHPLILDSEGRKLGKSRGSSSLRDLRNDGWSPDDVRRELGFGPAERRAR